MAAAVRALVWQVRALTRDSGRGSGWGCAEPLPLGRMDGRVPWHPDSGHSSTCGPGGAAHRSAIPVPGRRRAHSGQLCRLSSVFAETVGRVVAKAADRRGGGGVLWGSLALIFLMRQNRAEQIPPGSWPLWTVGWGVAGGFLRFLIG